MKPLSLRPPRLLRVLPLLALCACSTLRGKADDLARKGHFVEAAEIYDELVRKEPGDASLVAARDDLRWMALEQLLGKARRYRLEGNDESAEGHLEQFLAHRVRWNSKLNGALESSLLEEMEGTHKHFRKLIVAPANKGLALTADAEFGRKRSLLAHPEMAPILREMEGSVSRSGKAGCARLKEVPEQGPHWVELVARYCRRWLEGAPPPPLIPEALGAPLWSGSVEGMRSEQLELVRGRLARAFEGSPWFSPESPRRTTLALEGRFTEHRQRDFIRMTASWTDREPYTDHEERVEKIEEPYEEEETYYEKGEKKTRKVKKVRTREHKYTVPVTRFRDVPKTFEYDGLRIAVLYRFSVAASGVLDAQRGPASVLVADEESAHAYEHDVTFVPAGVQPVRASLPKGDAFFARQVKALERAFAAQLGTSWREYYCSAPSFTLDEAARCARAGDEVPPAARKVLAEVLGEDASRTSLLYARP